MRMKFITGVAFLLLISASCISQKYEYPFRNPDLSINERVDDLLGRLTPEEKVGQMMNQTPAIDRLGIPPYDWWNEALHGVARAGKATVFPQAIGMAATFDDEALLKTFSMVSDEARAKYNQYQKNKEYDRYKGLTFWTPNINIFRDPRWGRGMETYGEDPYLTGRMGLAVVKGLQGNDPDYFKTHACAKHYAVHSGPEWNRHEYNAEVSPRDLWLTYLPAFEQLVKEGNVQEVMCAYNRFEGQPCCGSDKLLIDILRNSWGYKGIILSDCGAIDDFWQKDKNTPRHETHPDAVSASVDAVRSGTDLECGGSYRSLVNALKNGTLKESDLDASLRRLFTARFELGMFDPDSKVPFSKIPYEVVESQKHKQQALEMAHKSIVLLKNNNNILPLKKGIKKIAVVGPNATDSTMLWSNYNGFPTYTVTILDGIRKKLPNAEVVYELGCNHTDNFVMLDMGDNVTSASGKGFAAEYFNNTEFKGTPAYKGLVNSIHFTTGGNTQFAPNVNLSDFTARFTGVFQAPLTGDIDFELSGNDGIRLFINDQVVSEMWESEYTAFRKYTLKAEKGVEIASQLLLCHVQTPGVVRVADSGGLRGTLLGGDVQAGESIVVVNLGGAADNTTHVAIRGRYAELEELRQQLHLQMESLQTQHQQLTEAGHKIAELPAGNKRTTLLIKWNATREQLMNDYAALQQEQLALREQKEQFIRQAKIEVLKVLHEGVKLEIAGMMASSERDYGPSTIRSKDGKLVIEPLLHLDTKAHKGGGSKDPSLLPDA